MWDWKSSSASFHNFYSVSAEVSVISYSPVCVCLVCFFVHGATMPSKDAQTLSKSSAKSLVALVEFILPSWMYPTAFLSFVVHSFGLAIWPRRHWSHREMLEKNAITVLPLPLPGRLPSKSVLCTTAEVLSYWLWRKLVCVLDLQWIYFVSAEESFLLKHQSGASIWSISLELFGISSFILCME